MIEVKLLDNNNIITLQGEGKLPVKSSTGYMFYDPYELLCMSVGACIGKEILYYCRDNSINVASIESLSVDIEDENEIIVYITSPKEYTHTHAVAIRKLIKECAIVKKLSIHINVCPAISDKSLEEITKGNKIEPCCGEK
jgi:uncharacterized OsmC-like protein